MIYRVKSRFKFSMGTQQVYHVQYKKKWWHKWRYIKRSSNENEIPNIWYSRKGANTYINQEIKRHGQIT